jgi:hypothetical protein
MHGATPPEPPQSTERRRDPLGVLPFSVNSELVVYVVVVLAVLVIVLANENLGAPQFVTTLQWLTIGYLLSRGIAKASRVFEV